MHDDFQVVTCLDCGTRVMFDYNSGLNMRAKKRLADGCHHCGSKECATYETPYYKNAKNLSNQPLHPAVKLAYSLTSHKRKSLKLQEKLVGACEALIIAADRNQDTSKLLEVVEHLKKVGINDH